MTCVLITLSVVNVIRNLLGGCGQLIGSGQGQVAGCCELGDKSLGFKNAGNLLTNQVTILKLLTPCILINLFSFTEPTKCTYV